jgi:hypothetical protein
MGLPCVHLYYTSYGRKCTDASKDPVHRGYHWSYADAATGRGAIVGFIRLFGAIGIRPA